jgi:deoxyribodipyrimidine photolyase-related protein
MPKRAFVIFPNQLYEYMISANAKYDHVFLVEDPIYFNEVVKPNKIKIAYLRAAGKCYFDTMVKGQKTYISCEDVRVGGYKFLGGFDEVCMYDPTDIPLMTKLKNNVNVRNLRVLPSPNFLMTPEDLDEYSRSSKTPRHASFYNLVKGRLHILENTPNLDKYNRGPPPKKGEGRGVPKLGHYKMNKYYKEGIEYAESAMFRGHVGNAANVTLYPITHRDAYTHLVVFLKERLGNFGKYQDAILQDEVTMYHAVISPAFNIGLLDPRKVVEICRGYQGVVPMEAFEGFMRQVIGWREYMRYLYVYHYQDLVASNIPDNDRGFKDSNEWYKGETGLVPLDNEIKKALETGYAHHIVRLMVFMNFFILCNLHPKVIYKWFMEVVSIDAYDWIMVSNIYAMGYFTNKAMSRPYISTSSYIVKMSDYKKDGVWDVLWDSLFYNFISGKPKKYVVAYSRNLGYYNKNKGVSVVGAEYIKKHFKRV